MAGGRLVLAGCAALALGLLLVTGCAEAPQAPPAQYSTQQDLLLAEQIAKLQFRIVQLAEQLEHRELLDANRAARTANTAANRLAAEERLLLQEELLDVDKELSEMQDQNDFISRRISLLSRKKALLVKKLELTAGVGNTSPMELKVAEVEVRPVESAPTEATPSSSRYTDEDLIRLLEGLRN